MKIYIYYSDYKKFWVVENSKSVIARLDQVNTKQNAKLVSNFDFCILNTKLTHKDLLKVLLIDFGFNGGSKKKKRLFLEKWFLVEQA